MPLGALSPGAGAAIGGISSGLASLFGASKAAGASKNASDAELQAAREALDFAKQQAAQRRKDLAGARNVGNSALESLAMLMGLPPPPRDVLEGGGPSDPNSSLSTPPSAPSTPGRGAMGSAADRAAAMANAARGNPLSSPNAGTSTMPTDVELMAPDGSRRRVPMGEVQFWLSKGAKRVM